MVRLIDALDAVTETTELSGTVTGDGGLLKAAVMRSAILEGAGLSSSEISFKGADSALADLESVDGDELIASWDSEARISVVWDGGDAVAISAVADVEFGSGGIRGLA